MKKFIVATMALVLATTALSASARELSAKEKSIIEVVARAKLKDPDSAKFTWQDYKGGEIYCAHINAKNSYGGYAGNALLMVAIKSNPKGEIISAEASVDSGEMEEMMAPICRDAGYQV